jgi:GNAT superfamily N-acetyltransferase
MGARDHTMLMDKQKSPERSGLNKLADALGGKLEKLTNMLQGREIAPKTSTAEQVAHLGGAKAAARDSYFRAEKPLPPAHGEHQDFQIPDKEGRPLVLRTEEGSRGALEQALQRTDTQAVRHPVRLNVYRQGHEAGYARLTFEVDKAFNSGTERYDRVQDVKMRLNDINIPEDERRKGIGSQLLDRSEELARLGQAREIYGVLESENARPFYEERGYSFRRNEANQTEVFKSFYLGIERQ